MKKNIKCLSVQQPHADLIIHGAKFCENRSWRTDYRGEMWIHASQKVDKFSIEQWRENGIDLVAESPGKLQTSVIIGSVDLVECVESEQLYDLHQTDVEPTDERESFIWQLMREITDDQFNTFAFGEWCWLLGDPLPLEKPIPAKGRLNLWNFEADESALRVLEPV